MSDTNYQYADDIEDVAVIGAGVMGHGIALVFAMNGHDVALQDIDEDVLEESAEKIRSTLKTFTEAGRITETERENIQRRISYTLSLSDAVDDVDFVTEAVAENIEVKQQVYDELEEYTDADTILATNTSGLSISEIGSVVERPERVVGTHWFNPPYIVPLVEVIQGSKTADAVVDRTYELMDQMNKTPVRVEKDIPGFIGNRIQLAMMYEAFSLLDKGVASAGDIDKVIKAGFGFRLPLLGTFEKADHSGIHLHKNVESYLLPELDRGTTPVDSVVEMVEHGNIGLKSGEGVYDWSGVSTEDVYDRRDKGLLDMLELYESRKMERTPSTRDEP